MSGLHKVESGVFLVYTDYRVESGICLVAGCQPELVDLVLVEGVDGEVDVEEDRRAGDNHKVRVQDNLTIKTGSSEIQGDQLHMAVCFWYLVKRDLSSVRNSTLANTIASLL